MPRSVVRARIRTADSASIRTQTASGSVVTSRPSLRRFPASAARTRAGASRPVSSSASLRKAAGRTARAAKMGGHRNHAPRKFTIKGIDANTRTMRRSAIVFWYRSPCMPSPVDVSGRRLDRAYSSAIRAIGVESPILSPIPPLRPRIYIAISIESRGGFPSRWPRKPSSSRRSASRRVRPSRPWCPPSTGSSDRSRRARSR